MKIKNKHKIIDIFSGCGGLSSGFEKTDKFKTCLSIDIWKEALDTVKNNKKEVDILEQDLSKLDIKDILKIKEKYGDIKVVVGGPPCQGFSQAGKRNSKDPRNQLYKSYMKFIKIINPEWFVFENVAGLMSMKTEDGNIFIDEILNDFKEMGYNSTLNVVSAKDFGVPQDRKRVIIIGNRLGLDVPKLKETTKNRYLTLRDAIGDLEKLESGEKSENDQYHFALNHSEKHIKWLINVPEGMSAHTFKPQNGMTAKGYATTYKRIWWDRPSPAITTCFNSISSQNNVHPTNTRALTIREAMRIQTFSDDFVLSGSFRDIRTQIGNAVPPKLAEEIAKQLLTFFE